MKTVSLLTSLFLLTHSSSIAQNANAQREPHSDKVVTRIAFGSCNNSGQKNKGMYDAIVGLKPDMFIFLGDNIYGDTKDMKVLKKKYHTK